MNETLQNLKERRSCRSYLPDPVPEEKLQAVLEAGEYAASGMGRQSGKIIAVLNPEMRKKISEMNRQIMGVDFDPFYGAPVILIVLANPSIPTWVEDGSLILGNMMNAAQATGLSSCWIHRARQEFDSEEGKALLREWGIDEKYRGIGHLALGFRQGEAPSAKPRKEDYVFMVQ